MDKRRYILIRNLFFAVTALSGAALGVAAVVGGTPTVWVRGVIITAVAVVLANLSGRAYAGSRGAYVRMRIMSAIAPIAVVVLVALPHDGLPVWMKIEQAAVGLLIVAAAVELNRGDVRRAFSRPQLAH